jgi:predicted peptidase
VYSLDQDLAYINQDFLLYVPENYNDAKIKYFPTLIFLHGRDEAGTDINLVKRHGLPKLLQTAKHFKFLVISPQCPSHRLWNRTDILHEFLTRMIRQFKVDPHQLYLTGISTGGSGTWIWAKDYPGDFAAIVPVSGACYTDISSSLRFLPVWIFHGLRDNAIKIHEDSVLYRNLTSLDAPVRFTVYPGGGHDIWDQTYSNPDLYTWLLNFKKE